MREQNGLTMEEQPRTRFGNYELVRRIDVGGMGEVYLAHQLTAFGRPVAIKIIRSDLVHDITARARFLREAEVSAHLKHEHILPLYDFGEVDGRLFLVTPYIEGGTLATRLKKSGPLPLAEARRLFVPLVQAVAYIHRRGVIHRDLKPTNVMLDTEDGEVYVRLIDFGIATLQGQSASPPLTMAGHEMGTVAYMAPERLSGIAAPSNDIFSLGVILHQLLTGRMPTATPAPAGVPAPRLPEPLAEVVRRAVATNPAERYATADELLKAFEQAYQQVVNAASATRPGAGVPGSSTQDQQNLSSRPELVSLAHSGELPAVASTRPGSTRPPGQPAFTPEDYSAPTTSFTSFQAQQYAPPPTSRPPLIRPPQQRPQGQKKPRKSSFFLVLSAAMVLVLVVLASMLYYGYQIVDAASVAVNFAPQVHAISQVVTLKADPNAQTVNPDQAIIPAHAVSASKTSKQTADTTGQVNCIFFGACQQGVDVQDVTNLVNQMEPGLKQSLANELQGKISAAHGTQIGSINFSDPQIDSNPQIGDPGQTVTVTLTEQGSVGYFLNKDETKVVDQSLVAAAGQLGPGYQLIDSTITIGRPETQSINPSSGVSKIEVPAGAVARYQFSQAQLQAISSGLVGKSLAAAEAFLKNQPGVDPTSVSIHFTSGSGQTMPGDTQHIKLFPLNQGSLPTVQLTPIPTMQSNTGTSSDTPAPAPTDTSTPTDNGN
jgi:serine/threonine protein kinase